ncbi:MAG: hypothetical protein LW630_11340 [Saprospiraceae bacterium]|nr:hypothetical protein [Saprospiraceae bacterium]
MEIRVFMTPEESHNQKRKICNAPLCNDEMPLCDPSRVVDIPRILMAIYI